jgi:hypothetical protein
MNYEFRGLIDDHFNWRLSENAYNSTVHPKRGHEGKESGQRYNCSLSLTSVLDWCEWSTPIAAALPPRKRIGTHFTGGWLGARVAWRGAENLDSPFGFWSPEYPARSGSLYWLSYPGQQEKIYRIYYFLGRKFVFFKLEKFTPSMTLKFLRYS